MSNATQPIISAAYVRKQGENNRAAPSDFHDAAERRIWDLLQTPQTVESLTRALVQDFGASTHANAEQTLRIVVDRDLVELSPDT